MSVKVMTLVWGADLGAPMRKLVALKLADCANDQGESIRPSIARVAAETGLSVRSVKRTLADLRNVKLLRVTRRGGPRLGPTRYTMNIDWLRAHQMHDDELYGVVSARHQGGVTQTPYPSREPNLSNQEVRGTSVIKGRDGRVVHAAILDDDDAFEGGE